VDKGFVYLKCLSLTNENLLFILYFVIAVTIVCCFIAKKTTFKIDVLLENRYESMWQQRPLIFAK